MNTNQCFKKIVDGLKRKNSRNEPYENWSSQQKEDKTKKNSWKFFSWYFGLKRNLLWRLISHECLPVGHSEYIHIEDITWTCGDTKYGVTCECSERMKIFEHKNRNFVSASGHIMFYLSCRHQWNSKPFQPNFLFLERRLFGNLSCSHSQGDLFTCFRAKALLTGISSVVIYPE